MYSLCGLLVYLYRLEIIRQYVNILCCRDEMSAHVGHFPRRIVEGCNES